MKKETQKILIVDDSEMNRSILADMLEEYEILEAENGLEAVGILQRQEHEISLVLLDIVMPEMDGFAVLETMNKHRWIEDIPVIMISAENAASAVERAYGLGVTDFISRPFDDLVVQRRVLNTIMLYAKQKKLIGMVADQIYEKEQNSQLMVTILSHIVEFRNGESGMHVVHIRTITELLLHQLAQMTDQYDLSASEIALISTASALHDIGKISIPAEILNKPGRLTNEEFAIMKTHSEIGSSMLEELPVHQNEPLVQVAYKICRWHHERYDGRGYPDGLRGEEIPIAAQVVALADVYDALTSQRVYKKAFDHETAIQMILNGECGAFSPLMMECLEQISSTLKEELENSSQAHSTQKEMRNIAMEMLKHEDLGASERTLRLLEHERIKYQFFASMSQEIQFEYTVDPPMITISSWGASKLGLKELIMDPLHDDQVLAIFGEEGLRGFAHALQGTSPDHPVVQYDCKINLNGESRWYRVISHATWLNTDPPEYQGAIGKAFDINDEQNRMLALERMASHDALTGHLNHASAKKLIQARIIDHPDRHYALFILDLDHFKSANDQYGHMFGDQVLQHLAQKLRQSVRNDDIAARIGGDEFLIFMEYKAGLDTVAERVFESLCGEFQGFRISVSMGIARCEESDDYDTLFHNADQALYAAKRGGRGRFCFYDASMGDMFADGSERPPVPRGSNDEH